MQPSFPLNPQCMRLGRTLRPWEVISLAPAVCDAWKCSRSEGQSGGRSVLKGRSSGVQPGTWVSTLLTLIQKPVVRNLEWIREEPLERLGKGARELWVWTGLSGRENREQTPLGKATLPLWAQGLWGSRCLGVFPTVPHFLIPCSTWL